MKVPCNQLLLCLCGLQLSVKGYNDKQHILLKRIIEKMATFEIDEKRFDIIKEAVSVSKRPRGRARSVEAVAFLTSCPLVSPPCST